MFNKRVISFVDLDDTLFQSHRKCEGKTIVQLCAQGSTKERSSYMSAEQSQLFEMLKSFSLVIPTTARDVDSFNNVSLDWEGPAILNHGGTVLLDDRSEDLEWKELIEERMKGVPDLLEEFRTFFLYLAKKDKLDIRVKIVGDSPLYLVVKHNLSDVEELHKLRCKFEDIFLNNVRNDFYIHFNDNNLAILPNCLNKVHAVRHILNNYFKNVDVTTFGVGDSLSDFDFMNACDFVISPSGSQLIKTIKERLS